MRGRTWVWSAAALAAAAIAVGCSTSSDDAASSDVGDDAASATTVASGNGSGGGEEGGGGGGLGLPAGDPIQAGRSIIATVDLALEVDRATAAATRAGEIAAASGGFVAQQDAEPTEGYVTLTLRIPTERLSGALGQLEDLGDIRSQHLDTQDVTEQVVDLEARIASARASVERVRRLLEESGDVTQLATVEGELARREADLESLLGRQRVLDDQVALATVHLDLREPAAVEEEEDEELPGFFGGLARGWDAFVTSLSVLVTGLGYALPFLAVAVAGGIVWWRLRRRPSAPSV